MSEKLDKAVREFEEVNFLWLKNGVDVWVERDAGDHLENDDVFIEAKLESYDIDKLKATVSYKGDYAGPTEVHITRLGLRDPNTYPELVDLVDLPVLNDGELHQKIRDRFRQLNIFTYVGPSLLIMNPFKFIREQYQKELKDKFYDICRNPKNGKVRDLPPHVWAISTHAYVQLHAIKKNQAICISGESGAGKTINTLEAMKFLTLLNEMIGGANAKEGEPLIEEKILMCNPILEALGNAKTVRNDNSSRFGKYISLFIENQLIVGASVKSYLLEAIRVTKPNPEERNYHIFYQLLTAGTDEMISKYRLNRNPSNYPFLKRSGCFDVKTVDDTHEYNELIKSMITLNVVGEVQDAFWRIISAVLLCSNIQFNDTGHDGNSLCPIKDNTPFEHCAEVLQVDQTKLHYALTTKTRVVQGDTIYTYFDAAGSLAAAESFAKDIYSKLFDWVVKYLNLALLPPREQESGQNPDSLYNKIGLLDIFGFEIFNFNSIEQLCINFTNEKLHQLYIEYVFKLEQTKFIEEGLKKYLDNLSFNDNTEVLDLLAHPDRNKYSAFNTVDDKSSVNAKDETIVSELQKQHKNSEKIIFSKFEKNVFTIRHTAKPVKYTIDGFIEKNKDEVAKTIIECVLGSTNQKIVDIYTQKIFDTDIPVDYLGSNTSPKENYIGYRFRQQMEQLMQELRSCDCSFMRCLKPNEVKSAVVWCPTMVVNQIRYLGLLDSINIRKESYPYRFVYKNFVERYLELEPKNNALTPLQLEATNPNYRQLSEDICKLNIPEHGEKTLLYGNTTTFMKIEAYEQLEKVYEAAVKIKKDAILKLDEVLQQVVLRSQIIDFRRKGMVTVDICRKLLSGFQGKKEYNDFKKIRKAVMVTQSKWRRRNFEIAFEEKKNKLIELQSNIQAFIAQKKQSQVVSKTRTIANAWYNFKKWRNFKLYVDVMFMVIGCGDAAIDTNENKIKGKAAIVIQKHWRGALIRMRYSEEVVAIRKAREEFLENRAKATLKRFLKGKLERAKIKKIQKAATFIQAYFKMRWTSAYYQKMRRAAITIQLALKDGLRRKVERKNKRIKYLKEEYIPFLRACYKDQSRLYIVDVGPDEELEDGLPVGEWQQKTSYTQIPSMLEITTRN